jgi:hypothetical protein
MSLGRRDCGYRENARLDEYTPVFDSGYIYHISPLPAGEAQALDVPNGSTTNENILQQYATGSAPADADRSTTVRGGGVHALRRSDEGP